MDNSTNSHPHYSLRIIDINQAAGIPHFWAWTLADPSNEADLKGGSTLEVEAHGIVAARSDNFGRILSWVVVHPIGTSAIESTCVQGGLVHVFRPAELGGAQSGTPSVDCCECVFGSVSDRSSTEAIDGSADGADDEKRQEEKS